MVQSDEDADLFQYFHAYYGSKDARSEYFAKMVRAFFEGAAQSVHDHILTFESAASPPFPDILKTPVFPYFRFLLATQLNLEEEAASWKGEFAGMQGTQIQYANDVLGFLSKSGRNDLAQEMFDKLTHDAPDEPGPRLNLFALALANGDEACQARCASEFGETIKLFMWVFEARVDHNPAEFVFCQDLFRSSLATGLRWLRVGGVDTDTGPEVEKAVFSLIAALDSYSADHRSNFLYYIFKYCLLDNASSLSRCLAGREGESGTVALVSACLDYALCVPGAEDTIARVAETDDGNHALLGLAFVHAEAGDLEAERKILLRMLEREPYVSRTHFHLASNRFRADDLEAANDWALKGVELSGENMSEMAKIAEDNSVFLEKAVAEDLPERSSDIDPWQDDSYTTDWWEKYKHQFENYTKRQDFSVFLNDLYINRIGRISAGDDSVKCVINFGSYCGHFDHVLAGLHKDLTIIGFDRDEKSMEMNRRNYSAPNLEFRSDAFEDLLGDVRDIGPAVLTHIRTFTMLYPAGVRKIFEQCHEGGIAYILGIEVTGYSFQLKGFPDFQDPERPAVVPFGVMVDHNYPRLLADAGYEVVSMERLVYPIIAPVRINLEMIVPMCYVARRKS